MGGERRAGRWMDLVIWIWANVSQARMEGATARAEQDLPGTQLTRLSVGYLPPHSLTLRASTIYSRPLGVRSDCPSKAEITNYQASRRRRRRRWGKANSQVTKSHKSLKAI